MKRTLLLLVIVGFAFSLLQCSGTAVDPNDPVNNPPADPGDLTSADKSLADAGNKFGLKLFREIVANEPDTNIFISPLSVSLAIGMTYNGAKGETKTAIQNTLELHGLTIEEVNSSYKNLIDILSNLDPKVLFEIANSIWYRDGIMVKDEFLNLNTTYFNSEVEDLDFSDDSSCDSINSWVDEKTHGKINEIISPPINDMAIMFLINAIYFKGDWTYQFDPEFTRESSFYLMDGSSNKCNMMTLQDTFSYYENEFFQAVDLPYGDGDYSMTIFLPKTEKGENVNTLSAKFTKENYETWLGNFSENEVLIYMPKFEIEYEIKLNDALKALGMEIAFEPGRADFTNIADMELYINAVRHKTYVKVDEEGTEAAAVTIVEIFTTSIDPPGFQIININHPFLFVIREQSSNSILFMGKIINPEFLE